MKGLLRVDPWSGIRDGLVAAFALTTLAWIGVLVATVVVSAPSTWHLFGVVGEQTAKQASVTLTPAALWNFVVMPALAVTHRYMLARRAR